MKLVECRRCAGSGIHVDVKKMDEEGNFDTELCELCFGSGETDEMQDFVEQLRVLREELLFKPIRPYLEKLNDWLTRKN